MTEDRQEHYKMAALAAGITIEIKGDCAWIIDGLPDLHSHRPWLPETNPIDGLYLIVRAKINVCFESGRLTHKGLSRAFYSTESPQAVCAEAFWMAVDIGRLKLRGDH